MSEGKGTAVTYCRVSGEEQARRGYSLPDQRQALREWCEDEGYKILEELADEGWSGAYLERPGLDAVRDLVAAGGVDVVVVLFRNRLARGIHAGLLADEFRERGTRLVALNAQVDDSPEGDLQGGLLDLFASYERSVFRRRSQRGLLRSARQGNVIQRGKAPYGFAFSEDGKGLLVHEPEMAVLRRLFRGMADGRTGGELMREFEAEGIPSPSGLPNWNTRTVAFLLGSDLYRPHAASEVAALVSEEVAATLDPERVYGLWAFNRRATRKWKERGEDGYRTRHSAKVRPMEKWLLVPVDITDAGLDRATVDRAREQAKDRYRKPSTAAGRFWELRGIARCAECGAVLSPHTVKRYLKDGTPSRSNYYYQCRSKYNDSPRDCDHTRSYPAERLEAEVWNVVGESLSDPDALAAQYDTLIRRMRQDLRSDPQGEERRLRERLGRLERMRDGHLDQQAEGLISMEKLREKLADLDAQKKTLELELSKVADGQERIREMEELRDLMLEAMTEVGKDALEDMTPEDRHAQYRGLRLRAKVDRYGTIHLEWAFQEVFGVVAPGNTTWDASG